MKSKTISLSLFIILLAFFTNVNSAKAQDSRPNILLIMTDQHQANALSVMGNKDLKTPNLDKLASNGMLFNNAYVTFPLCTPSRSSMFTGKMPHSLGVNSNINGENSIESKDKNLMLAHVLKAAGYDCAYGGKWHVHEADMVEGNAFEMIAPMGDIGLAEKSIAYLESKKDSEKPFFLTVSYDNPHNICEWARSEPLPYGNIESVEINKTPELPKNHKQASDFPEVLKIEQNVNKKVYPTALYTDEDWRQYRNAYYRLVEKVDTEIGKILEAVEDLGLSKNTLIIFTSDHGDGNGSHQWNQKTALIQESVKVPFIVSFPGKIKRGKTNDKLVSNGLDLYPTIAAYTSLEKRNDLLGENLQGVFEGNKDNSERSFIVSETKFEGKQAYGTTGRTVIGNRYKYIIYNWGKNREQLFDLKNDPFEMNNLIANKKFLNEADQKRLQLYNWCMDTNDKKFLRKLVLPSTSKESSSVLFDKPY